MTKVLEVPLYVNNWKSDIVKEIKQFELFGCCKCENLAQSIVFAGDSILLSSFCDTSRHYLWHFLPQRDRKYNRAVTKPPSSGQCGHFCGITKNVLHRAEENISSTGEIIVRFDRLGCFTFPRDSIIFRGPIVRGPIVFSEKWTVWPFTFRHWNSTLWILLLFDVNDCCYRVGWVKKAKSDHHTVCRGDSA